MLLPKPTSKTPKQKRDKRLRDDKEFQALVTLADGGRCQNHLLVHDRYDRCTAHHIIYKSQASKALRNTLGNGITLCWECHEKVHGKRKNHLDKTGHEYMLWILEQHKLETLPAKKKIDRPEGRWYCAYKELKKKHGGQDEPE